jgi:hypothetical protein
LPISRLNCEAESSSPEPHRHLTVLAARRPHPYFNVLPQTSEKLQQPPHRKTTRPIPHQQGDVRLFDPERRRCLGLRHTPLPDDAVNLQREAGFDQLLLRVGQAEIGKHISAAGLRRRSSISSGRRAARTWRAHSCVPRRHSCRRLSPGRNPDVNSLTRGLGRRVGFSSLCSIKRSADPQLGWARKGSHILIGMILPGLG